ncbi:hypothetical protein OH77DRAFT_108832 [Trametes cingulata]|nr:hypothetical protein OH77DRAFT_108832 [Trametes cingulata]
MSTPRGSSRSGGSGPRRGGSQTTSTARPQHRVYKPGKRHMELMPSVSRSSGLDKDGDALRDPKVQEEYRDFIQTKVEEYWKKYPLRAVPGSDDHSPESVPHRKETEENLLILFRKLREGLMSAQRRDQFAREVYETSLHLSVLFRSPAQATSTLSHLFPGFYVNVSDVRTKPPPMASASTSSPRRSEAGAQPASTSGPSPPTTALTSTLIFLLHHLVSSYPSQLSFHTQLRQLHPSLKQLLQAPPRAADEPRTPSSDLSAAPSPHPAASQPSDRIRGASPIFTAHNWLVELARCLRRRNYARLDALTRRAVFSRFVDITSSGPSEGAERRPDLALEAIQVLVDSLVEKAGGTTWNVLRTAYREVNLRATPTGASVGDTTALWLARSLVLRTSAASGLPLEVERKDGTYDIVEQWLTERSAKGEARRKEGEGMEGRWILVKA